jgi:hypothetical protein
MSCLKGWDYTIFALDIKVMALEIKRTPVLEGEEAIKFLYRLEHSKIKISTIEVDNAMSQAHKILSKSKISQKYI